MGRIMEINQVKPLSANEKAKLEQLEGVIRDNIEGFVKVGMALAEIRDRQLYRVTHRTFEQYVRDVFDIRKTRAYQLIDAAEVVQNVHNCGQISWTPKNEAQARPLARIVKSNPGQLPQILEMAIGTARDGKITASHMDRVVKKYLGETVSSTITNTRTKVATENQISADFKAAFDAFLEQIQIARDSGYKSTSRLFLLQHLDAIRGIIADDGETIEDPLRR